MKLTAMFKRMAKSSAIKRGIALSFVVVLLLQSVLVTCQVAYGSNYSMLGTNSALGSPILDPNFTADEWNKWELLTWGVFLSNFAVPLVDDYDSAFDSNATTGSKGAGFKALQFGSGSDPANADTIKGLLNYAVTQQKTGGTKQIYVAYSKIARNGITKTALTAKSSSTDITTSGVRPATFKDLFLMSAKADGDSWVKLDNIYGLNNENAVIVPVDGTSTTEGPMKNPEKYVSIATINDGALPTFYVKSGSGYEEVLDYTDGWDAQLLTAWIARVACGDFKDQFKALFEDMFSKSTTLNLNLDCFGNITVDYNGSRRIIIPASINQHLTDSPKINLVSSMLFNGINSGVSGPDLNLRGQQSVSGWFGFDTLGGLIDTTAVRYGGAPALGSHVTNLPSGLISMYYDLDTIADQTYFNGGDAAGITAGMTRTVSGEAGSPYYFNYGKGVKDLFDLDATKDSGNKYIFKIEAANVDSLFGAKNIFSSPTDKAGIAISNMIAASGQIANIAGANVNAKVLSSIITNEGKTSLFGDPVIIPVQMMNGYTDNQPNSSGAARLFMTYLYQAYMNGEHSAAGDILASDVSTEMTSSQMETMKGFKDTILGISSSSVSPMLASFVSNNQNTLFKLNVGADKIQGAPLGDTSNPFKGMGSTQVGGTNATNILFNPYGNMDLFPGRLIKAYPESEVMRAVGNVLGVRPGTEFALYSTYIYMTYLDWYGVKGVSATGAAATSEFNPRIFDGTSDLLKVDINSITAIKTDDDKKKDVLNYTYMMLHPTDGVDYRNQMMQSYLNNFIYDSYQKIVYGNASTYYSDISSKLATRNATGFLSLDTYSDNFMTAWLMAIYSKVAIFVIAISFILIIIIGLLKGRKISWFVLALIVVVNTILVVPSAGEVTPAVINNFVQKMFSDKMTYWGISEAVTNATMESDYVNKTSVSTGLFSSLTQSQQAQVVALVKTLNVVYLDRALMLKDDISRKVTQTQGGNYAEIQKLRSARWMLPMIMRQFTANDGSADYVYVPIGDMYDDISNLYWLYKPTDAATSGTINGQQTTTNNGTSSVANVENPIKLADRATYYPDYVDTTVTSSAAKIPYRSQAYTENTSINDMPHTYSYLLEKNACPLTRNYGFGGSYTDSSSFQSFVDKSLQSGKAQSFMDTSTALEQQAGTYDRGNRATMMQSFGYLWATESPFHYFYESVKDCFPSDITLGALVGDLQGQYVTPTGSKTEVRTNFMYSGQTGYIKDVADLQELFTNTVPYLYEMQITAGGMDGKTGVLGAVKIDGYPLYANNYKSWMYRSNWATKLMESPELSKQATVRDANNTKFVVKNPMLIECYPSTRPMVFSEAQMHNEGLNEADLDLAELKAIQVNKDIAQKWTLLLNYANVQGMTKEVLIRQMSTDAVTTFDEEYSPSGLFNGAYAMYPDGLDLRGISFDSVMKMLMLNVTKDTTYIYGDTMQNIIANCDMFSAALLLIAAFLCSYVIPLVRDVTMGLIFYLGFVAIVYALLASTTQKVKASCGYLISNLIFMVITLIYYAVFSGLMAVTTSDAVLTVQSVQVSTGNPVWCFIIIIIVSIAYISAMFKMIDFCFKNYRDMGFEVYSSVAGMITESISGGIDTINDKISNFGNDSMTSGSGVRTSGNTNKLDRNSRGDGGESSNRDGRNEDDNENSKNGREYDTRTYKFGDDNANAETDSSEIDKEIEKGKSAQGKKEETKGDK